MIKPESLAAARKFWERSDAIDAMPHPTTLDEIVAKESAIRDLQVYVSSLPKEIMDEIRGLRRNEVMSGTQQEIEMGIKLPVELVAVILEAHRVPHRIHRGRIYADTMEAFAVKPTYEDVTNLTLPQLKAWLGY